VRVPHLSPTTLTTDEQRLILRTSAGNVRDHVIYSLALGTGLRSVNDLSHFASEQPFISALFRTTRAT
jgi:hypothetical protein